MNRTKWIFTCMVALLITHVKAQTPCDDPCFQRKVDSLKVQAEIYDDLSPFSDDEDPFEKIEETQSAIIDHLTFLLNDPRIVTFDLDELFANTGLHVTRSEDHRVYVLTIDELTGGSYRSALSTLHLRYPNGSVSGEVYSDAWSQVHTVDQDRGVYMITSSVLTCNTCTREHAILLKMDSSKVESESFMDYEGRYYDLHQFGYNEKDRTFAIEYSTPDFRDSLYGDGYGGENDEEADGVPRTYRIRMVYQYKEGEFVLIEDSEEVEQPEEKP